MAEKKGEVVLKKDISDAILERINQLQDAGFVMPPDYNAINAIKMSMIVLGDLKNKDGKSYIDVCTPESVSGALFKMVTKGLNLALNQCYAIVRGSQLTIDPGYFGNALQVKRIYPDWEPCPRVIRKGDEFTFETDPKTGRKKLVTHVQTLESLDEDFLGGYIVLPTKDGEGDLYIMTKKEIIAAWSKSSSVQQATHKAFPTKMIGKTLVNSGCTMIINSNMESQTVLPGEDLEEEELDRKPEIIDVDAEEVKDEAKIENLEVKDDKETPESKPSETPQDDPPF